MWHFLCCWADHISKTSGLFLVWDTQIQNCYHGAGLSAWNLGKGIKYGLLYSLSDQNLYLGDSEFYFLHDKLVSITRFQNTTSETISFFFSPNDIEPPLDLTAGSTQMKTDSFLIPCIFAFPGFYSAPRHCFVRALFSLAYPLHSIPHTMKQPVSFWAFCATSLLVMAGHSLHPASVTLGCLNLIHPSSYLRLLLHFFLTSIS